MFFSSMKYHYYILIYFILVQVIRNAWLPLLSYILSGRNAEKCTLSNLRARMSQKIYAMTH